MKSRMGFARLGQLIDDALDFFWSGRLVYVFQTWHILRRLDRALSRFGENSIEARRWTERCRELNFAFKFWRAAPPLVRLAISDMERVGFSLRDLRLLNLNREIRQIGNRVALCHPFSAPWIAYIGTGLIFIQWLWLLTHALSGPFLISEKIFLSALVTAAHLVIWPGFALYGIRPLHAHKNAGAEIQAFLRDWSAPSNITTLPGLGDPRL